MKAGRLCRGEDIDVFGKPNTVQKPERFLSPPPNEALREANMSRALG